MHGKLICHDSWSIFIGNVIIIFKIHIIWEADNLKRDISFMYIVLQ